MVEDKNTLGIAHLDEVFFSDIEKNEHRTYHFYLINLLKPEYVHKQNTSDKTNYKYIKLKGYSMNTEPDIPLIQNKPTQFHFPNLSFTRAWKKRLAYLNLKKDLVGNYDAEIMLTRMTRERMEITNIKLIDKNGTFDDYLETKNI